MDSSPKWSVYRPAVVFGLTCIAYMFVIGLSFSDVIFTTELGKAIPWSDIETGRIQVPPSRQAGWLIMSCILLELYWAGFCLIRSRAVSKRFVSSLIAITAVLAFIAVPFDSTDLTVYINQGWLQSHYHLNPYNICVGELKNWMNDPMFKQHWIGSPCNYGPLFALIACGCTWLGHGNYMRTIYLFKLVNLVCHIGISILLYRSVKTLTTKNTGLEAAYLYGLSPFMLLHMVSNAHNDLIMMFFSVLAFTLVLQRKFLVPIFSCMVGAAVKYLSLLLIPGLLVIYWRTASRSMLVVSAALGCFFFCAVCAYYWLGVDSQHFNLNVENLTNHLGSLCALLERFGIPQLNEGFRAISTMAYIGLFIILFISWLQEKDPRRLSRVVIHDSVMLTAIYLCVLSAHFRAWYVSMFFPLGLLIERDCTLRRFCILSSCTMLFSLMWFGFPNEFEAPLLLWGAFILSRLTLIQNSAAEQHGDTTILGKASSETAPQTNAPAVDQNAAEITSVEHLSGQSSVTDAEPSIAQTAQHNVDDSKTL